MTQGHKVLRYLTIIFKIYFLDFGEPDNVTGGKQVFACHNFLDYSGEARNSSISINIEETMAILTRLEDTAGQQNGYPSMSKLLCLKLEMLLRRWVLFLVRSQFPAQLSEPMPDYALRFRPMQLLLFLLPFRVDKLIFSIKLHILYFLLCYNHFLFHSDAALTRATDSPYFCWEAFPRWQSWFRWDLRPKLENSSSSEATSNGQCVN